MTTTAPATVATIKPLPERLPKLMYNVREGAAMLGMSESQFRRLCREGIIRTRNTGKAYFASADSILAYARGADSPEKMRHAS